MNPPADREVTRRTMFQITEYQARFLPPSLTGYASYKSFYFVKDNKTEPLVQKSTQLPTQAKKASAPRAETHNKIDYTSTYRADFKGLKGNMRRPRRHEGNLLASHGLVPLKDASKEKCKQKDKPLAKDDGHSEWGTSYTLDLSTTLDQPQESWLTAWTSRGHLIPQEVRESLKALTMKLHSQLQGANPAVEHKHQSPKAECKESKEKGGWSVQLAEKGKMAIQDQQEDSMKAAPQPASATHANKDVSGCKLQSVKKQTSNNQPPQDKKGVPVWKCSISLHQSF